MHRSHRLTALTLMVVAGCSGGAGTGGVLVTPNTALRSEGARTAGGEADAFAAALLLSAGIPADRMGRAKLSMTDTALRAKLIAMSVSHLQASGLTAGNGAGQMGSALVRRLAAEPGAPVDRNGNGTNLDEVLAIHYDHIAQTAGGVLPSVLRPILFPWRDGSADFASRADPTSPSEPTRPGQTGRIDMAQVGHAMLARLMLGSAMLRENPDGKIASIPDRQILALLLLHQVVAMEETLFTNLFMDGAVLTGLRFPTDYDPAQRKVWVPQAIDVSEDPKVPGLVIAYSIRYRSSNLEALASLMRVGGELSFLASDENPDEGVREVFRGRPFGPLPKALGEEKGGADNQIITWDDGPSRILKLQCVGCHDSSYKPEPGLFAADSYDNVHKGSRNARPESKTPIITRGDPSKSVLYYILLRAPPFPFVQMPQGSPMPKRDIDVIKKWIEDGARNTVAGPPRIGIDLAETMFKNFVAMHVGPKGEMFERHDGESPVPFTNPVATGAALQALASLSHLAGEISDWKTVLEQVAEFAHDNLTNAKGEVVRSFDIANGTASGTADLLGHARMTAGLLAASRVLGSASLAARAEALAKRLITGFFDPGRATFRSEVGVAGARYTPVVVASVVDALREMAEASIVGAVVTFEGFMKALVPVMVFSELSGTGEILGDGIADTDSNGIREPALAGGEFGRAPVFTGEIKDGVYAPPADAVITWSKHIQPLFRASCGRCHMNGSSQGDGYLLDTPALLRMTINAKNPMAMIVPGDPDNSYLYRKLVDRRPAFGVQMPEQQPPLAEHGKVLVRRWILEGATRR